MPISAAAGRHSVPAAADDGSEPSKAAAVVGAVLGDAVGGAGAAAAVGVTLGAADDDAGCGADGDGDPPDSWTPPVPSALHRSGPVGTRPLVSCRALATFVA